MNTAMTATAAYPVMSPGQSLESYIASINNVPMLSAEEEYDLATQLRDTGDLNAARGLILPHLRFVVRVARGYSGYGLALPDLIQEGTVGLMKAVKRFDPDMGVRLVSFAVHWVKAEIHEFVIKNWRIVKVATTKAQRKLFFNLRGSKKRLGWFSQEEVEGVAADLGVKPETVLEMEKRLSAHDMAFDNSPDDDDALPGPSAYLADNSMEPARAIEQADMQQRQEGALMSGLETLNERSRDIITARWLNEPKATLHELADKYGVSAERIRQIERDAMKKLRGCIEAAS